MKRLHMAVMVAAFLVEPGLANAQDASVGQSEFMNSCAQCHGVAGKGDGVMAGFLATRAPDLTQLQKTNGGVFPFARVYNVVNGEMPVGPHGSREMPAWGRRYAERTPEMLGFEFTAEDQQIFVRGRILALVEYISTLQEP